jgi:hypothetical protein
MNYAQLCKQSDTCNTQKPLVIYIEPYQLSYIQQIKINKDHIAFWVFDEIYIPITSVKQFKSEYFAEVAVCFVNKTEQNMTWQMPIQGGIAYHLKGTLRYKMSDWYKLMNDFFYHKCKSNIQETIAIHLFNTIIKNCNKSSIAQLEYYFENKLIPNLNASLKNVGIVITELSLGDSIQKE